MKYKETVKTIVIAVLLTGIVAFVAGVRYQTNVQRTQDAKSVQNAPKLK